MYSERLTLVLQYLLPKKRLSFFAGLLANVQRPSIKNALIRYFIRTYKVNMAEACYEKPEQYVTFNAFFIRHLKPQCRPIAQAPLVSPVDGRISEIGLINQNTLLQAKGHYYTLDQLLASDDRSNVFENGLYATFYLSPKDYHRVHMPMEGILQDMCHIPGSLFSVQPATTNRIPGLFARNERLVVFFQTATGPMAMVLVGATIVGSIGTSWHGDLRRHRIPQRFLYKDMKASAINLKQAAEMGYFKLGSTVILLLSKHHPFVWESSLKAGHSIRFGEVLAIPRP